ncbi:MAG: glycoside hydrolase family 13 protein [Turicibacter sp.]|nr:glycoside hydrolase family 13 protein [Turicibacter sp.]
MLSTSLQLYTQASLARTYLNADAIFSDETQDYVTPYDPNFGDTVSFSLRTAKNNVESATLYIDSIAYDMTRVNSDSIFDYYSAKHTVGDKPLRYYFSISTNDITYFYNKRGLREGVDHTYDFRIIPGFSTPDWAKGAVMYQIFVDRFYNGDPSNDPVNREYLYIGRITKALPWDAPVESDDICNFYGGDLQGIIDKMPYLADLGVEALYLNPIFVSPSSHKYDIQDYDHIDPHFGVIVKDEGETLSFDRFSNRYATKYMSRTAEAANLEASDALFVKLVEKAHENGIKVILDGVFNHCGCYNKWLDKPGFYKTMGYPDGAYRLKDSQYHNYFLWHEGKWPNNNSYDSWWGNDNHPKLNFEDSPELYDYIMEVGRKWVSPPFNADGWRLDVAADLGRSPEFNHKFWQDFRKNVKSANPEAIILAEHYGDITPWISGGEWDTVMNYDAFMEPLTWFLTGVSKHSEDHKPALLCDTLSFEKAMRYHMAAFNVHALQTAMNQLSNHDHSRFLTRTSSQTGRLHTKGTAAADIAINKSIMLEAVVFQMTWPGAPTIYYGDEAGLTGWTDPDNRRPYPWGNEDETLLEIHKELTAIRKLYPTLKTGSAEFLWNEFGLISFGRWDKTARLAIILNNNPHPKDLTLPVWKMGAITGQMSCLLATFDDEVNKHIMPLPINFGKINLTMPKFSTMILVNEPLED